MALTKKTELYESLVRYEDEAVKGMQVQYITKYYDDGVLVATKLGNAEKVAVLDGDEVGKSLVETIHTPTAIAQQKTIDDLEASIILKDAELLAITNQILDKK